MRPVVTKERSWLGLSKDVGKGVEGVLNEFTHFRRQKWNLDLISDYTDTKMFLLEEKTAYMTLGNKRCSQTRESCLEDQRCDKTKSETH